MKLEQRLQNLERRVRPGEVPVTVVFVCLAGHELPDACADALLQAEYAERPWHPGEPVRYLRGINDDGTCCYCGQVHRVEGLDPNTCS